ncbi:hypothetical protein [Candidatus Vidania fulgoroideorum]
MDQLMSLFNKKYKKICFFGTGNVGLNFFNRNLKKFYNYTFFIFIKKNNYLIKKKLEKKKNKIFFFKKYNYFLKKDYFRLVIEVTGNIFLTKYIFNNCLRKKKIITANKKFICLNYSKISSYINRNVFIEPSILGGIPIIDSLINHFSNFKVKSIYGILNGTTNHIIYNMIKKKYSYKKALNFSIIKGYSEKRYSLDISGSDSFYKIYIALRLLNVNFEYINKNIFGIGNINIFHILKLKNINFFPVLIGFVKIKKHFLSLEVYPYVKKNFLKNQYNKIKIDTYEGKFSFSGKGAGGKITSFSLLKDFLNIKISNNRKIFFKNYFDLDIIRKFIVIIFKSIIIKKVFVFIKKLRIDFIAKDNFIFLKNLLSNKRIKNIKLNIFRYLTKYIFFKL